MKGMAKEKTPPSSNDSSNFEDDNPLVQLANKRIVMLSGDIEESPISIVIGHLFNLAKQDSAKPIHLVISTYGGSVDDMLALYDVMRFVSCPIHTLGLGKIMSAGIFLLAAGEEGERQIGKNARCMYHLLSSESDGTVLDQENEIEEAKRMQDQINEIFLKHTKLTKKELNRWIKAKKDIYLTAQQAINHGIADKFLTKL